MLDIDCRRVLHVWDGQRQAGDEICAPVYKDAKIPGGDRSNRWLRTYWPITASYRHYK